MRIIFKSSSGSVEGTAVLSTGETVGKVLQADGDNTSSWVTLPGGGDALTTNPLSQFSSTTSLQLAGVISDETGSGSLCFATSPTLVTPAIGTPSSGILTNCTGLPSILVADESTDTTCFPLFATAATGELAPKSGSNLTFNSSTGELAATLISGSLANSTAYPGDSSLVTVGTLTSGNVDAAVSAASDTAAGKVELATNAETLTGTDTTRAVTPAGLASLGYITSTLTDEEVQDKVGAMVSGNTETNITVTYQDSDGTLDFVVDDVFLLNNGDVGTGVYDFGGADSFEIPNSAAPTVNTDGEIAIDTTITDWSHGIIKYYSGEEMAVVALPVGDLTSPTDGHVIAYNATDDEFELVAQSGGGGSQTPWASDIDADGFDLNDLSNIEFRATAGAPAGTVLSIHADAGGINYNVATGDVHDFWVNGAAQAHIDVNGIDIAVSNGLSIGGIDILTDSSGTTTLNNIDAVDSTTKTTIRQAQVQYIHMMFESAEDSDTTPRKDPLTTGSNNLKINGYLFQDAVTGTLNVKGLEAIKDDLPSSPTYELVLWVKSLTSHSQTNSDTRWIVRGKAHADGEDMDVSFDTDETAFEIRMSNTDDTVEKHTVTLSNMSIAAGEFPVMQIVRTGAHANDDFAATVHLINAVLKVS